MIRRKNGLDFTIIPRDLAQIFIKNMDCIEVIQIYRMKSNSLNLLLIETGWTNKYGKLEYFKRADKALIVQNQVLNKLKKRHLIPQCACVEKYEEFLNHDNHRLRIKAFCYYSEVFAKRYAQILTYEKSDWLTNIERNGRCQKCGCMEFTAKEFIAKRWAGKMVNDRCNQFFFWLKKNWD
uniref:Uncharacterized protein n=1 Tax=Panagrolaimus sp. ES5 TaxID=591445 RepID=A0AC34GE35_9BILA